MVDNEREFEALRAYAKTMNTLQSDYLEPFLADDLRNH
jgi:hypothetical protein